MTSVFFLVFSVIGYGSLSGLESKAYSRPIGIAAVVLIVITGLYGAFISLLSYGRTGTAAAEAARILGKIEEIQLRNELAVLEDGDEAGHLTVARLNLNQIHEYYAINKTQARNSFTFSMIAISAGLSVLVIGIVLLYENKLSGGVATLSGITGLFLQLIGGLNLVLYRKCIDQLYYFYQRLSDMHNAILALKLCEGFLVARGEFAGMELPESKIQEMVEKGYDNSARMRELIIKALLCRPEFKANSAAGTPGERPRSKRKDSGVPTSPSLQAQKS